MTSKPYSPRQMAEFLPIAIQRGLPKPIPKGNSKCWVWTGATHDGHPVADGKRADVRMYQLHKGSLGGRQGVRQTCRNLLCVNPWLLCSTEY